MTTMHRRRRFRRSPLGAAQLGDLEPPVWGLDPIRTLADLHRVTGPMHVQTLNRWRPTVPNPGALDSSIRSATQLLSNARGELSARIREASEADPRDRNYVLDGIRGQLSALDSLWQDFKSLLELRSYAIGEWLLNPARYSLDAQEVDVLRAELRLIAEATRAAQEAAQARESALAQIGVLHRPRTVANFFSDYWLSIQDFGSIVGNGTKEVIVEVARTVGEAAGAGASGAAKKLSLGGTVLGLGVVAALGFFVLGRK